MKRIVSCIFLAACVAGCGGDAERAAVKGDAAVAARDPVAAAKHYAASTELGATNREVYVKLSVAAAAAGDRASAVSAAEKAVSVDPASAEARLAQGNAAYLANDGAAARAAFDAVAAAADVPASLRAQALAGSAVADIAENRVHAARVKLWRALRLDMRCVPAWYHLGYLSRNTWQFDETAIEQFEMAGRLAGTDPRAVSIQRKTLPALRESYRLRLSNLPGVATRDPKAAALLVTEGEKALARGKLRLAGEKFRKAWERDPLSYAAAWNHVKRLVADKAPPDRVLAVYAAAIDAKPASQPVYQAAAKYALANGRAAEAEKFLSRALSHDANDVTTLDLYIRTLQRLGRKDEANTYAAWRRELR